MDLERQVKERTANKNEIIAHDYSLAPSKYIEFVDRDLGLNYQEEMERIQKEFADLLGEEKKSQQDILDAFKGLGYEIRI